mmetsp:Transcript_42284/g.69709  ORF Transcript_42284/g.69709 Transcript_42284/m.69709 type:complete len:240 (+) Transcript_42284:223-942(+)
MLKIHHFLITQNLALNLFSHAFIAEQHIDGLLQLQCIFLCRSQLHRLVNVAFGGIQFTHQLICIRASQIRFENDVRFLFVLVDIFDHINDNGTVIDAFVVAAQFHIRERTIRVQCFQVATMINACGVVLNRKRVLLLLEIRVPRGLLLDCRLHLRCSLVAALFHVHRHHLGCGILVGNVAILLIVVPIDFVLPHLPLIIARHVVATLSTRLMQFTIGFPTLMTRLFQMILALQSVDAFL